MPRREPVPTAPTRKTSWHLPTWDGSARYEFSRKAIVTSDSAGERPLSLEASGAETFTRSAAQRTIHLTLAQQGGTQTRIQLSAAIVSGRLVVESENVSATTCDAGKNQLRSDLSDLATPIPSNLSAQMTWADSETVSLCVGGAPGTASSIRRSRVVGDTTVAGEAAIIVNRSDSTVLAAEGTLDQHPVVANGNARSSTLVYVAESAGKVLLITKNQELTLTVKAESRVRTFVQKVVSRLDLVR